MSGNKSFKMAHRFARSEVGRLTDNLPKLQSVRPFSPDAYNAISAPIWKSVHDLVLALDSVSHDSSYLDNLAVHLFREFSMRTCFHYFREYERIMGFVDPRPETGFRIPKHPVQATRLQRVGPLLATRLKARFTKTDTKLGYIGASTFPIENLVMSGLTLGLGFSPLPIGPPISIPRKSVQLTILREWNAALHAEMADLLGLGQNVLVRSNVNFYEKDIERLLTQPAPYFEGHRGIVTGTLGGVTRTAALRALAEGVANVTMYHGSHYMIFDECYHLFYEGYLTDAMCGFGNVAHQTELGTLEPWKNLNGVTVRTFSRTDPDVVKLSKSRASHTIPGPGNLVNRTVAYFAGDLTAQRYGPFRDVHPATYLAWQEDLLKWLERKSGKKPILRLHPKRLSTRWDPLGYKLIERGVMDTIKAADVLVIDYPTTVMAFAAASEKPVLFTDIGFRRIYPMALDRLKDRCHYARIDMQAPEAGFEVLEKDLDRVCVDSFTPIFSNGPKDEGESLSVARAIGSMI